ncbi:MAG: hypothetical protein ACREE5_10860 [Acetobacteraceae bacterium]
MDSPDVFAAAPTITVHNPLASFLGVSRSGAITHGHGDAVQRAGRSFPTVTGAFLMARKGLASPCGDKIPEPGGIDVYLSDGQGEGAPGVVAAVSMLLTGAAPETGLAGVGPGHRFARRGLVQIDAPIEELLALKRCDTGRGVMLDLDTECLPPVPGMRMLLPKALSGLADEEGQARFGALWQSPVAHMLVEHADDPALVEVAEWEGAAQAPAA